MPADSPFTVPWWYRTEFTLPAAAAGQRLWLRMAGVNYRFDAWLNGTPIASATKTAGAFRAHEIDVTGTAQPGANALAVLVSAPTPGDLAITFVDWNPMPPDKLMGLYRPVTLTSSGPVALRHPQVVTTLAPGNERAELTVKVFATNAGTAPVTGTLRGHAAGVAFQKEVALAPSESREIVLAPSEFPKLVLAKPRLWWPAQYGEPVLHDLELEFVEGGVVSDRARAPLRHPRVHVGAAPERPRLCGERPEDPDPWRRLELRADAALLEGALRAGDRLRQGHGPQHDPARGQARGRCRSSTSPIARGSW